MEVVLLSYGDEAVFRDMLGDLRTIDVTAGAGDVMTGGGDVITGGERSGGENGG